MTQAQLLKHYRKKKGLTQRQLAELTNIGIDAIKKLETSGTQKVMPEYRSILSKTLGIDEKLLEPPVVDNSKKIVTNLLASNYLNSLELQAANYVPYYEIDIMAGKIEAFSDIVEVPTGYIYAPEFKDCVACRAWGDSMANLIMPGAVLIVKPMNRHKYIDYGQIYIIVLEEGRFLKYVNKHPTDPDRIILRSHNTDYEPWEIEKRDIISLFLVKSYWNHRAF